MRKKFLCYTIIGDSMKKHNDKVNNELIDMINISNKNESMTISNYKLDKYGSKKFKKTKYRINVFPKKVIALAIGTVVIASSVFLISKQKNNIDKNNYSSDNMIVSENSNYETVKNNEVSNFKSESVLKKNYLEQLFDVSSNKDISYIYDFMETPSYNYFIRYADMYGVDPQIMLAIAMQESGLDHESCLPNGDNYNNCAIGIMQLEKPYGSEVTAYNFKTGDNETIVCTKEYACDIEKNIQISCMLFQNSLRRYNGNVYLAIQSHNYGETMINTILDKTSLEIYKDKEKIINDYEKLPWLKYVQDVHENPSFYLTNWDYDTYGDSEYLAKVLSYCTSDEAHYIYDDSNVTFNLRYGATKSERYRQR